MGRSHLRALVFAVLVAAMAGAAWSQELVDLESAAMSRVYADLVRAWPGGSEVGALIVFAAREGAGLEGQDGRSTVCATLPGTGGNPRLDGGGNPRLDGGFGMLRGDWGGTLLAPFPAARSPLWSYDPGVDHEVGFPAPAALARPQLPLAVIDAFDAGALAAIGGGAVLDAAGLWTVLVASGFGGRAEASPVAHGNLVLFHLLVQWAGEGSLEVGVPAGVPAGTVPPTLHVRAPAWGAPVEVHLLDIVYGDVGTIRDAMAAAQRLGGVVVVASWGLVDCTLAAGYHAAAEGGRASTSTPTTFAAYVAAALQRSGRAAELMEALCVAFGVQIGTAVGYEVDCERIRDLLTVAALAQMDAVARQLIPWIGETVVFASAGNQGLPFPMPPAAWPGVVGVEACIAGAPRERAAFSNVGTTRHGGEPSARALGAWFSTPAVAANGEGLGYWGTSFAAPAAAAAYAADPWPMAALQFVAPCSEEAQPEP
jgi:hypothetical protein